MKKLLFIISILFLAATCEKKTTVNISVNDNFNTVQSGFIKASLVAGFDHVYDSCTLLIDDFKNAKQYKYESKQPVFNNLSLSSGNYGLSVYAPDTYEIQFYMSFIAYNRDIDIITGVNNIVLQAESSQSLILVDKASVDSGPTIKGLIMERVMHSVELKKTSN